MTEHLYSVPAAPDFSLSSRRRRVGTRRAYAELQIMRSKKHENPGRLHTFVMGRREGADLVVPGGKLLAATRGPAWRAVRPLGGGPSWGVL